MMTPEEFYRYERYTAVVVQIAVLINSLSKEDLDDFDRLNRQLEAETTPKTGVSGDLILEFSGKIREALPLVKRMRERSREIMARIRKTRTN